MVSRTVTALALSAAVLFSGVPARAQTQGPVYVIPVTGVIEMGLAPFVERGLREAGEAGAAAVILDIDTPGGRVDSAERIADAVAESPVPVYAYVNTHAYSAGALISLATRRIYMRRGSVLGAVTPVDGSGTKMSEKIVSAMRAQMRALAEARDLDPAVAEAMVDEELAIEGVVEAGKLLTLTTAEAVALGYAHEVEDLPALLRDIEISGAAVSTLEVNWAERVVRFLSNPIVAPFLLSLGFLGLIIEIKTPSFGMAGAAGLTSLALFFGSHMIVGLAGLEDLIFFAIGVVLIGVEVMVIPGFGLFGILGGLAVAGALYMSMIGSLPTTADFTRAGLVLTTTILLIIVTGWALLRSITGNSRLARSGVFLYDRTDSRDGYASSDRRSDLVGREGTAVTDLRPSGTGLFGDERVDVVSDAEWIPAGSRIRVVSAEGYRHVVRGVASGNGAGETDDEA
ncbi:MAG: nodulation protein NfeD [Gemmatimonadota bacterium]|nr:nodulation protein NfeD [Gemmatimonadota bacterium]